ncbi:MAG: rhodanese-like domain-containing protein [Bosea sp. (in: a-proteobacteria)]|uniref:rhodanese-like domain-containing protein n=1 Tax=Bosea sp. (in: a-proteobacteria) TaxID=1871050 RepID=UPI0027327099|nr:rhodanese-like domain-containing protein [Bosea sp. (in: a-proteobacteria)]MDP3257099.1 rhodanese-like domain-containing protein [Bosea sp. (in: a-proteobacteria)]MDP3319751.1 rhodanese-like domain-containing protein [Bosea sp. (in: a-proteobacteria)]
MSPRGLPRRLFLAGSLVLPASLVLAQASQSLTAREAYDAARAGTLLLIDIRPPDEWRDTGLPRDAIALDVEAPAFEVRLAGLRLDHRGKRIALIDRSGALAASTREKLAGRGFRDIVAVRGGMLGPGGWLAEKLPVVAP